MIWKWYEGLKIVGQFVIYLLRIILAVFAQPKSI
jgi:hypothetical protein